MKKNNKILKIIFSSSILTGAFFTIITICVLMLFNFFGAEITVATITNNYEYAEEYRKVLNNNFKNGYVPLARILYFYLEDDSLSFDEIYKLNINEEYKTLRDIESVCSEDKFKNMTACSKTSIKDNQKYLIVNEKYFSFPLASNYTITSFFSEERIIYDQKNIHNGWDFGASANTPIYSSCNGEVYKIVHTQDENVSYDISKNGIGNSIILKCDEDYGETYYIAYEHIYPHSFKVKVGDKVKHTTPIAEVGTTGYSNGNHCHIQLFDKNWQNIDIMQFIDLTIKK